MSMFPGAGASVYTNEEGEVLGWDYNYDDAPDVDDFYGDDEPDEPTDDDGFRDEDEPWEAEDAWLDGSYEE